jgi:hypothetical protein
MLLSPVKRSTRVAEVTIELPRDVALERADDLALGATLARPTLDVATGVGVVDHADARRGPRDGRTRAGPPALPATYVRSEPLESHVMDREDLYAYGVWVAIGAVVFALSGLGDATTMLGGAVFGAIVGTVLFFAWRAIQRIPLRCVLGRRKPHLAADVRERAPAGGPSTATRRRGSVVTNEPVSHSTPSRCARS